ncbi:MAG: class I SAM-dependent methyltransferase, partial [Carbonactinosporaceae bacterium]
MNAPLIAAERWRASLAAWEIPEHIRAAAGESAWVMPRRFFARRAERSLAAPEGPSYLRAREALQPAGSVLDVGAGGGAACLPLAAAATRLMAVDSDPLLLDMLAEAAGRLSTPVELVTGRWPDVAGSVPPADVVVCHHVLYNVPDVGDFVRELAAHARRRVVIEITGRHPLTVLNPLWWRFHQVSRPEGPTADDALEVLAELGIRAGVQRWTRPPTVEVQERPDDLVEVTRRRLCLPPGRAGEVADALRSP